MSQSSQYISASQANNSNSSTQIYANNSSNNRTQSSSGNSQTAPQISAGCVMPPPRILCTEHQSQITHGCTLAECNRPLYCGQCVEHQHEGHLPYQTLKPIEEFTFELSRSLKQRQVLVKRVHRDLIRNVDNANLLQWQDEIEPHLKQIESYVRSQKLLIESDLQELQSRLESTIAKQRANLHAKLDEFLRNYRAQFADFKQFNAVTFRVIASKFKYLSDPNIFNAKLNSLDSETSRILIEDVKSILLSDQPSDFEAISNKSAAIPPTEFEDVTRIFKEMNMLINNLPAYQQITFDEDIGNSRDLTAFSNISESSTLRRQPQQQQQPQRIIATIESTLETHFQTTTKNFFIEPFKLSIPQPTKRRMVANSSTQAIRPPNPRATATIIQKHHNLPPNSRLPQQQNSNTSFFNGVASTQNIPQEQIFANQTRAFSNNVNYAQPNNTALSPAIGNGGTAQNSNNEIIDIHNNNNNNNMNDGNNRQIKRGNTILHQSTKTKIFDQPYQSQQQLRVQPQVLGNQNNSQLQQIFTQQPPQYSNNPPRQIGLGRSNSNNNLPPNPNNNNYNNNFSNSQGTGAVMKSNFLSLRTNFKMKLQTVPWITCYLSKGFIAMAQTGDKIRVLDVNSGNLYEEPFIQQREIKFMATLTTTTTSKPNSNSNIITSNQQNQSNLLTFAVSTIDSVIFLYTFNTKTMQISQRNEQINGFMSPVCRIIDLFGITGLPLLAAGDESGEVSVFDYETTIGDGLEKIHQTQIAQLIVIPKRDSVVNPSNNRSSLIQAQSDKPRFVSLGLDQVLVVYEMSYSNSSSSGVKFSKVHLENVSNIGGGIMCLRAHPEYAQFFAVCQNGTLKLLRMHPNEFNCVDIAATASLKVKDLAVFSAKDHQIAIGNAYLEQKDPYLSGLIFASEQDSQRIAIAKTSNASLVVASEENHSIDYSNRKLLYVDSQNKLFIFINNYSCNVQLYDILL